nr:hypothetical protein [Tanacetum cinerariifolium]
MAFKQLTSSNNIDNHPHEAIDTVLNCVIPYIQNGDDRNSVSLVYHNWYELDCMTRKHVTVHMVYSLTPFHLHQRFPSIKSLTLKGSQDWFSVKKLSIDINPWIQEISVSFKCLKLIHIRHMDVHDSNLELLARARGRDLRVLKICKCKWFSTDGLLHIGKYCNDLRTLCLKGNQFNNKDGEWLHELALQKMGIESLDFRYFDIHDVKDLTLLAKNCCRSLVSLKISEVVDLTNLVDVFSRCGNWVGSGRFGHGSNRFLIERVMGQMGHALIIGQMGHGSNGSGRVDPLNYAVFIHF